MLCPGHFRLLRSAWPLQFCGALPSGVCSGQVLPLPGDGDRQPEGRVRHGSVHGLPDSALVTHVLPRRGSHPDLTWGQINGCPARPRASRVRASAWVHPKKLQRDIDELGEKSGVCDNVVQCLSLWHVTRDHNSHKARFANLDLRWLGAGSRMPSGFNSTGTC